MPPVLFNFSFSRMSSVPASIPVASTSHSSSWSSHTHIAYLSNCSRLANTWIFAIMVVRELRCAASMCGPLGPALGLTGRLVILFGRRDQYKYGGGPTFETRSRLLLLTLTIPPSFRARVGAHFLCLHFLDTRDTVATIPYKPTLQSLLISSRPARPLRTSSLYLVH